jgi:hypothetical protein
MEKGKAAEAGGRRPSGCASAPPLAGGRDMGLRSDCRCPGERERVVGMRSGWWGG